MLLQVVQAVVNQPASTFRFVVPGHEIWTPRAFRASAIRAPGGAPDRSFTLTVTDGTNTVAAIGADDIGTEPGIIQVTWANTPAAASTAGILSVTVAPFGPFSLRAGYEVIGTISGAVMGDTWQDAVCWTDFVYAD